MATTDAVSNSTKNISQGSFTWAVSTGFLGYLASPATGGDITTLGETAFQDGGFTFPVDTNNSSISNAGFGQIALDGGVIFQVDQGLGDNGGWGFELTLTNFKLNVAGTAVTLIADYTRFAEPTVANAVLVTFELPAPLIPFSGAIELNRLTTAAAQGMADSLGHFPVGTQMAPADITLSFERELDAPPAFEHSLRLEYLEMI